MGALTAALVLSLSGLGILLVPLVLRRTASTAAASHLLLGSVACSVTYHPTISGGYQSATLWWLATLPVAAMLLVGKRSALAWGGFGVTVVAVYSGLELSGMKIENTLGPVDFVIDLWTTNLGLTGFLLSLAFAFDAAKRRMAVELEDARRSAEQARDDAQRAHAQARMVLDSVDQALIMVDRTGHVVGECSAAAETWFGAPPQSRSLWSWLRPIDPPAVAMMELCFEGLVEDVLPMAVSLEQIPRRLQGNGRYWEVSVQPLLHAGRLDRALIVMTDVTAAEEARREQRGQLEIIAAFKRLMAERQVFLTFYDEVDLLVRNTLGSTDLVEIKRNLHTIKGNCAMFEVSSMVETCHAIESKLGRAPTATLTEQDASALQAAWQRFRNRLDPVIGAGARDCVAIRREELTKLRAEVLEGLPATRIAERLLRWGSEPIAARFRVLSEQAQALSIRLGKALQVVAEDGDVFGDARDTARFWSSLSHVIRNAVYHGIETPDERLQRGKPGVGRLLLRARETVNGIEITVEDDGRGIDWEAVRRAAESLGVAATSSAELTSALFADGLTTRKNADDIGGRGVGLAALASECSRMGVSFGVESRLNEGTSSRFSIPRESEGPLNQDLQAQ